MLLLAVSMMAFPVTSYDFQLPWLQVSPVTAGIGGLNLSLTGDPGILYSNPAMLAHSGTSVVSLGMKLQDRDQIDVVEMFNAANVLRKNQIVSLHMAAEGGGFGIRSLAAIDENRTWTDGEGNNLREHEDYRLTAYQIAMAQTEGRLTYGLGFKYLNGRLVYLREQQQSGGWLTEDFVDDRLHGLSFDFSLTLKYGAFVWGFTAWDIYSHLWWMNNSNRAITRRLGSTVGWQSGNTALITGAQRKWGCASDQTYHIGVQQAIPMGGNPEQPTGFLLRGGAYSHDFDHEETTWTSLGVSYYIKAFRVDTSMATHDLALNKTRFLLTVSMGM